MFAGLAIYQEQREDLLLCTNRSLWTNKTITITGNQQSIVSKTSYIILVLYDLEKYTSAVATFNITTSKCTGILINPCEFEAYCSVWPGTKFSLCDSYLGSFSSKYVEIVKEKQYFLVSMNVRLFQSHEQDYDKCVHLYLSSNVAARLQNISQSYFNDNLLKSNCYVNIKIQRDAIIIPYILTSTYQGTIKRSEMLQFVGHGNVVTHNFLVRKQKNSPVISIHQCKYKVKLSATAAVNFESVDEMLTERVTHFILGVKGGSSSTMMLQFKRCSFNLSMKEVRLKACSNMSQKNQIPISFNFTYFELHNNVTTVMFGQILIILMSAGHYGLYMFKNTTVQLMIKASFCYFKTVFIGKRKYKEVLNEFDPFNTEKSNKMYGNKCVIENKNYLFYLLYWSQILTLPRYNNTKVVSRVLLPGLHEQVSINIGHTPTVSSLWSSYLDVAWQDTNILQRVDISLRLNGKQHQIFTDPSESDKMYTWMEAEAICTHHGGHLPSISNQSDAQDLVDIILRAAWTGPIRMIYIGLKVSNVNKIVISSIMLPL